MYFLYFQYYVCKKFFLTVIKVCRAAIFFRDGRDRSKTGSGSLMSGGAVSGLSFSDVAVEIVCGDHIQAVAMADLGGQAEVSLIFFQSLTACNGIFH